MNALIESLSYQIAVATFRILTGTNLLIPQHSIVDCIPRLSVRYENAVFAPLLFWIQEAPDIHWSDIWLLVLRNLLKGNLTKWCVCGTAFDLADSVVNVLASGIDKKKTARRESTGLVG
jgi:hypothetical protein